MLTDNIDNYTIKSKLDYYVLLQFAEDKLITAVSRFVRYILLVSAILAVGILMMSVFNLSDHNPIAVFGNLFAYFGFIFVLFASISIIDSFRKINRQIFYYKGDLRRIQEKLSNCGIFMDVPDEDYNKYNNVFKLFSLCVKKMQKKT